MSGSNCCDPERVYLFLREPDGSFAPRREVTFRRPDVDELERVVGRGTTRPHLLDWNRDGRTDLVVYVRGWKLYVSAGPLTGKAEVAVAPVELPVLPGANPFYFDMADWDADGAFDLLAAMQYRETTDNPWNYGIFWFRNTAAEGEPRFAAASRLLTVPRPWKLNALTAVDWGQDGRPDLVAGVTRTGERKKNGGLTIESQLWAYRRRN